MTTLAMLYDGQSGIQIPKDITLFLVRGVKMMYEIWGVSNDGEISHLGKPIPLNGGYIPPDVSSLEDIDCEHE